MNSNNQEFSESTKVIRGILVVSIILFASGCILNFISNYINLTFLSYILATTGAFTYTLCIILLFMRKEEPGVANFLKKMVWGIAVIAIIYSTYF